MAMYFRWGLGFISLILVSCAKTDFTALNDDFRLSLGSIVAEQKLFPQDGMIQFSVDLNFSVTQIVFRLKDDKGNPVIDYDPVDDLIVNDDGKIIKNYEWRDQKVINQRVADIALLVDITGSMTPTIELVKSHLLEFLDQAYDSGKKMRFCLSTFGDYTVTHCRRFYTVDKQNPQSLVEINELKKQIRALKALKGKDDPGGTDLNENPLRAIMDASEAPFGADHERFVIVITDDMFLYSPSNRGQVGNLAPYYHEVLETTQSSNLKLFLITPEGPGYNQPFRVKINQKWQVYPSLVEWTQGRHYPFQKFVRKDVTIKNVLEDIHEEVLAIYEISYEPEKFGIFPHLKRAEFRSIKVSSRKFPRYQFEMVHVSEKLSLKPSNPYVIELPQLDEVDFKQVLINNQKRAFRMVGNKIEFEQPLSPDDVVQLHYRHKKPWRNWPELKIEVMSQDTAMFWVTINGVLIKPSAYRWEPIGPSKWRLKIEWSELKDLELSQGARVQVWLSP